MVTSGAARLLRLEDAGRLEAGLPADLVVVPSCGGHPIAALVCARRSGLSLVAHGGRPLVAAPGLESVFEARQARFHRGWLDGRERLFEARLADRISKSAILEPGVEVTNTV
jgi:hypothetical protein